MSDEKRVASNECWGKNREEGGVRSEGRRREANLTLGMVQRSVVQKAYIRSGEDRHEND